MINTISFQFGTNQNIENLNLSTTPVTVFVGPNNSGKSKVLTEIDEFCRKGTRNNTFKIIEDISFLEMAPDEQKLEFDNHVLEPVATERTNPNTLMFGNGIQRHHIAAATAQSILANPNSQKNQFCVYYLSSNIIKLDALNRISLVNPQNMGDLQQSPQNHLSRLFRNDSKRMEVRRIVYDALKLYFVLDPTNGGQLRVRLSKVAPKNHEEERGLHHEAVKFHKQAMEITEASDGVKAFTGIVTSIIAGKPKVTVLDEPEAFLHPSLSTRLGKEISTTAQEKMNRLFVSTHSANFLMGCIQSGAPINVVRLTYSNEVATARVLDSNKISTLMKDPLLRSTGVLNALFYQHVIVTEGDSDRAFYQEINERLLQFSSSKGIHNCLFINAVGKDTIWKIVGLLREMGIPAVGIYDIDILKNEGSNWTNALKSSFVPEINQNPLGQLRASIKKKFNDLEIDMKKDGGISALPHQEKEAAENLFNQLEDYGLFVVRNGEVEHWLSSLKVDVHKSNWLPAIFEKMGSNPSSKNYVKPSNGDVWDFMEKIGSWMTNDERRGIPG